MKQVRFVEEYLFDLNATQAAIRAGYSPKTAAEIGYENLKRPQIADAIAEAQAARSARTQLTQDDVIARLLREADREDDGASHGARVQAIGLLGKHLGMFREKLEHDATERLAQAAERIWANAGTVAPGSLAGRLAVDEE